MKKLFLILFVLVLISCDRKPAEENVYDRILDLEIARRKEILNLSMQDSIVRTKLPNLDEIQSEIDKLILLTKDAENISAVIDKANTYFLASTQLYNVPYVGFVVITNTMSLPTIESTIKSNQLNLLDKIIFTHVELTNDSTIMGSVY